MNDELSRTHGERLDTARRNLLTQSTGLFLAIVAGIELAAMGVRYGTQVVIARLAGSEDYGWYTIALTWANTLAVPAGLGLAGLAIRYVPQYLAQGRDTELREFLRTARLYTASCGVVLGLAAVVTYLLLDGSPNNAVLLALGLVPTLAFVTLQGEILRGSGKLLASRIIPNLVQPVTVLIATLTLFWISGGLSALQACAGVGAGLVICVFVQGLAIRHALPVANERPAAIASLRREWLSVGSRLLSIRLSQLILNNSDILMVGVLLGPLAAGIYGAAVKTALLGSIVTQAVNLAVPPRIAALHASGRHRRIQAELRRTASLAFLPSAAAALFLAAFAEEILSVFGPGFSEGALSLSILAVGRLVTSWTGPVGACLNVTGYHSLAARVYAFSAVLQVVLTVVLIPISGIAGAAAASTAAMVLWNIVLAFFVQRRLDLRLWPLPPRTWSNE